MIERRVDRAQVLLGKGNSRQPALPPRPGFLIKATCLITCDALFRPNLQDYIEENAQWQLMIQVLLALTLCADWSPRLAADYLDSREKEWFAWKTAQTPSGPCVSCHTGVTYLLVRPELRRKLGETARRSTRRDR